MAVNCLSSDTHQNQASLSYSKTLSISNEWSIKLVKNTLSVISVCAEVSRSEDDLHIPFNALIEKKGVKYFYLIVYNRHLERKCKVLHNQIKAPYN